MRGAILGLLVCVYHFLSNCLLVPYHFCITCYISEFTTRCQGSHSGVAGMCIPFPYHFFTKCLPSLHQLLARCRVDNKMRGEPFWGCWCVCTMPYNFLAIYLSIATCAELTTRCQRSNFGVAGVCIPFPYNLLHVQN